MKNLFTVLAIVCSFMWTSREVSAQVKFRIGIMPDKVTYQVFLRPDTTWAPPFNSTVSSQLSLRVPTGGFQANNVTSNKGSWKKAVHVIAPSEAPDYDYLSFSLSLPTNDITYSKGTEVLLFTFQNTGNCTGEIKFIDNQTDPFLPPNSQNVNVGNQITVAGAGPGVNAYAGPYYIGGYNCLTATAGCGITYNGIDYGSPTTCGAADGYIEIFATTDLGLPLQYSIDNGQSWQSSPLFTGLVSGAYRVRIRDVAALCLENVGVVELPGPLAAAILDIPVRQPDCGQTNGRISIIAFNEHNDALEYSIDNGQTWQPDSVFTNLAPGTYNLQVRNLVNGCASDVGQITLVDCPPTRCLVYYELDLLPDGRYQVALLSDTTWAFPQNITSSMQITLKVPAGSLTIGDWRNEVPNVTFDVSGVSQTPAEAPDYDYYTIGLTTPGTGGINYRKGLKLPLFSFANEGVCSGDSLFLMENDDPFLPPNSLNANVGQQITVFGGGPDLKVCLNENKGAPCIKTPVKCLAEFELSRLADGKFQVAMTPDTAFSGNSGRTTLLRTTIKVPTGGFDAGNLTSLISGVNFTINGVNRSPNEAPDYDYFNFELVNIGTNLIPYVKGQKVPLFTFENTGSCTGDSIAIMDPLTDPFKMPNSLAATVGLNLKISGYGVDDVPVCYVVQPNTDCPNFDIKRDTIYVTIPTGSDTRECIQSVIDLPNSIGSAALCGNGANVNAIVADGSDCVDLQPGGDFHTTNEICVIHCDANLPGVCDTTIIIICPELETVAVAPICAGESVDLEVIGGAGSFSWSPSTGLSCTNCMETVATPATTTTYTVTANAGAQCSQTATVRVEVNPKPTPSFTYASTCLGNPTNFTNTTPSPGAVSSWTWDFGDGNTSTDQNTTHLYASNGAYLVTLSAATPEGCSAVYEQTVTIAPASTSGGFFEFTLCEGESIPLNAQGGVSYQWSPATGLSNANIANPIASPAQTTTYVVDIAEANGCGRTDTFHVVVNRAPVFIDVLSENLTSCDSLNGEIKIFANDGANPLEYSIDCGQTWHPGNFFQNLDKGTYCIQIRSTVTNCVAEWNSSVILTGPTAPSISGVTITPLSDCDSQDAVISINATATGTLEYSIDGGNSWQLDPVFAGLSEGSYRVMVRLQGFDCTVPYGNDPVIITKPVAPSFAAPLVDAFTCNGEPKLITIAVGGQVDTFFITGTSPYQNASLSNGTLTFEITPVQQESDYTVELVSDLGCRVSESFKLFNQEAPKLTLDALTDANCGQEDGQFILRIFGGQTPFQYDFFKNATLITDNGVILTANQLFENLGVGSYLIRITDGGGCVTDVEAEIEEIPATFQLNAQVQQPKCGASDGQIILTTPPAGATFQWRDGQNNPLQGNATINDLSAGTYTVSVTDQNGCDYTEAFTLEADDFASIDIEERFNVTCAGEENGAISFLVDGSGSFIVTIPSIGFSRNVDGGENVLVEDLGAGIYEVIISDGGDCSSSIDVEITEPQPISLSETLTNPTYCDQADGVICIRLSGGRAPFQVVGDAGMAFNVPQNGEVCLSGLEIGNYQVRVIDASGCEYLRTFELVSANQPVIAQSDLKIDNLRCPGDGPTGAIRSNTNDVFDVFDTQGQLIGSTPVLNLPAGNYSVSIIQNGCEATLPVVVGAPAPWEVEVESTPETCETNDGTINLLVQGANGGYNFDWADGINNIGSQATELNSMGSYAVTISDSKGCQYALTDLRIGYDCPDCAPVFALDSYQAEITEDDRTVCLPLLDTDLSQKLLFLDNQPYLGNTEFCVASRVFYDFNTLMNIGSGPYRIVSWTHGNGVLADFVFSNISELVDRMNAEDPFGNWAFNPTDASVVGGTGNSNYSPIRVMHIGSNTTLNLGVSNILLDRQSIVVSSAGLHSLVVLFDNGRCPDTLLLNIVLIDEPDGPDTLRDVRHVETLVNTPIYNMMVVGSGETLTICSPAQNGLVEIFNNAVNYTPNTDFIGIDSFCIELCDAVGNCAIITVYVDVFDRQLKVYNGLSPNDDGSNDVLYVENIEYFPGNKIIIFNRWGNKVFEKEGYRNNWDGHYQGRMLPDGTYFYLLEDGKGKTYTGYLQILR